MPDVPTSRGTTAAVVVIVGSVVASAALFLMAAVVAVARLMVGMSIGWAEVVLIGGTLALTAAGAWWLTRRGVR